VITIQQYFMRRDGVYGAELTAEHRANAAAIVARINLLIAELQADEGYKADLEIHPKTKALISSGWRPAKINALTPGAAVRSKHMTCQACDLYDPDGDIDEWALAHPDVLERIGLWQEHPSATKGWAHFQIVPPRSGKRVFYP
jgi:hypothetical protein